MRSALVAITLGRQMGLSDSDLRDAFYSALLMHVGCVALAHETVETFGDEITMMKAVSRTNLLEAKDWFAKIVPVMTEGMGPFSRLRFIGSLFTKGKAFGLNYDTGACEVGTVTAQRLGLPASTQRAMYEISEYWQGGGAPRGLKGNDIVLPARVARVAADAAFFDDIGDEKVAVEALRERAGGLLDPDIVETFAADPGRYLSDINNGDPRELIMEMEPEPVVEVDVDKLPEVAAAFGDVADLKSPYFHGNSTEVARLSHSGAEQLGLDSAVVDEVQLAGLLRDVGRVGITDVIWEKKGKLTTAEWEQVRMHAYHSERILAAANPLEGVSKIVGMHHERLDGSGYHRSCDKDQLSMAVRVLAAADVYGAMRQDRPHRKALSNDRAKDELTSEARAGRLDPDAVSAILAGEGQTGKATRSDVNPGGLTDREIEVLCHVASGSSNAEVGQALHISRRTAEHHIQHIYTKIGVSTRPGAALFALRHDLLSPSAQENR
jgi:HD-GYP domain-containing protein (c-di-GMP phosphodiesterase class II)/DNA-binding CsgD family transcriptional regulator